MDADKNPVPGTRGRWEGSGFRDRAYRFFAMNPEGRVYPSRRWDAAMLVCGPVMVLTNVVLAISGGAGGGSFRWSLAVIGFAVTLTALSDLLVGCGGPDTSARRAVLALRVVVQVGYLGVLGSWAWAAVNGSGMARFALASGLVAVVLVYWFRWALEADRRDDARGASGGGSP